MVCRQFDGGRVLLASLALLVLQGGCPRNPSFDLRPVRQRVDQEITSQTQVRYRIDQLLFRNGWLVLVLKPQTRPPSDRVAAQDAEKVAKVVELTKVNGRYVKDLTGGLIDVTIWNWGSFRTVHRRWDPVPPFAQGTGT